MKCESCPFENAQAISPEIREADLLIVGEAPGAQEIRTGKPFTGPSGHLLWNTLRMMGVERDQVAITNALSCSVPYGMDKSKGALREACLACRPRLLGNIEDVRPKTIVALGNTALQALESTFGTKITQERGMARRMEFYYGSCWVVPTLHPAAILRGPVDYRKFAVDLRYAVHLMNGGEPKNPGETKWKFITTDEEFEKAKALIRGAEYVGADIETSDLDPLKHWILFMGVCYAKNKVLIFRGADIPRLRDVLEDPNVHWEWWNGKFDTKFIQQLGIQARVDGDGMLRHYCLDENRGTHDLKQQAAEQLGAPDYDSVLKKYVGKGENGWAKIPPSILVPYLAKDCDYTFQMVEIFENRLDRVPGLRGLYEQHLLPSSNFLQRVERNGMYVSPDHLETVAYSLAEEREEVIATIQEIVEPVWDPHLYAEQSGAKTTPVEFNPKSPKQLSWVIYDRFKLRVPGRMGIRDTKEETLNALPPHPLITSLLRLRKINKQMDTYAEGILREISADGRTHSTYMIHGTATGRLSSRNPNAQNVPRNKLIRDIFQAPPGKLLVDTDFDQAELRMLAHLSEDAELLAIYREGRKLHDEVALDMFGPNYTSEQRMRAKAINFGIVYGRTEFSLVHEFGISLAEAQRMIQDWFARFPDAKRYIMEQRAKPLRGEQLISPFGRRRRYPFVPEKVRNAVQNESANFAIQSAASDLTLMVAMEAESQIAEVGGMIVNLVHDSILAEIPASRTIAEETLRIFQEASELVVRERLQGLLDFPMDAKIGVGWGSSTEMDKVNWDALLEGGNDA